MRVYRITSKKYSQDISGKGAAIKGGRWNKKGSRVLYTSMNASLSCLEIIVHLVANIPTPSFELLCIDIPQDSILELSTSDLPTNWYTPDGMDQCSVVGQNWIEENEYLGLKVPSSIVSIENNILINPLHPLYSEVKIVHSEPFNFDNRLLK